MTKNELDEVIKTCPTLYHMAERGSWDSIRRHGLLSTSELLNLYRINGEQRSRIEEQHRPESVTISCKGMPPAVVRDQKPMSDAGLTRALIGGLTPVQWYRLLNRRVFFWLTRERLLRLMSAKAYRNHEHDVLEVDTRAIVDTHYNAITLSPINSGCTKPFPHPRGPETFLSIADYPYSTLRKRRRVKDCVVELCVDGGVLDITKFVTRVSRMRGGALVRQITAGR